MAIVPNARPKLSAEALRQLVNVKMGIDRTKYPFLIVGIRGYYLNTMGIEKVNDRGIFDDAIFIDAPGFMASFNGNTDPDSVRKGFGLGKSKGMACLKPGLWPSYQFGNHKMNSPSAYPAIRQVGSLTVIRDGVQGNYEDTGSNFGINIHRGGRRTPGSEGCQTIYPDQWDEFLRTAYEQAQKVFGANWKEAIIPYLLINNDGTLGI